MTEYYVEWCIDIEAGSPEEAARKALEIHRNHESIATVFRVFDHDGNDTTIDLTEIDDTVTGEAPTGDGAPTMAEIETQMRALLA